MSHAIFRLTKNNNNNLQVTDFGQIKQKYIHNTGTVENLIITPNFIDILKQDLIHFSLQKRF
jgi:hypothetical protein